LEELATQLLELDLLDQQSALPRSLPALQEKDPGAGLTVDADGDGVDRI
jgi:hypothetical protein